MLNIQYYVDTAIRTEIWARATLYTDFDMSMGFNTSLQMVPGTTPNQVAEAVISWASFATMYYEGAVEVETNILPVGDIRIADAPNLTITFKKGVTESLSPMVSGIALLG